MAYFKDFPQFIYDFNYGDTVRTTAVVDITANIRFKKEVIQNVTLWDQYNIVDGETPEIISERFYGTPNYHWIIMIANEKYDYLNDFPLPETTLQKHIETHYNPTLYSDEWSWTTVNGRLYFNVKITSTSVPFKYDYITSAPVSLRITDDDYSFDETISYDPNNYDPASGDIYLNEETQIFSFAVETPNLDWLLRHGLEGSTAEAGVGRVPLRIETQGREHNPIYFENMMGVKVSPGTEGAIAVTGDVVARQINDEKRRIKIIHPNLLETILSNFDMYMTNTGGR